MKELIIKQSEWGCGANGGRLLDGNGFKCCIGFYSLSCGLTSEEIIGFGTVPMAASHRHFEIPEGMNWLAGKIGSLENSEDSLSLMEYNDSEVIGTDYKKEKIAEIFAKHGVTVKFVP